eukprot:2866642-Prymnesium_polylepis.1
MLLSHNRSFRKRSTAGIHGCDAYAAAVRPSSAAPQAARSVMLLHGTWEGSLTRDLATRLVRGGHAPMASASYCAAQSNGMHARPLEYAFAAGIHGLLVESNAPQHAVRSVITLHVPLVSTRPSSRRLSWPIACGRLDV